MINGTYLEVALSWTSPLCCWEGGKNSRPGKASRDRRKGDGGSTGKASGATDEDLRPFGSFLPDIMKA